ncbi:MAG TPA: FtsX-like permease family protein [Candidatus Avoscillospira stercorigallinarum]|uniref:FtsX-like permease family protein n=1 Tax=Candidatus Avoscillospira stercorigallinarum TaxID=2840708 RepID=A0A9D0Z9W1_9FIRM|nr:FtsX-like permease family protein [Candidatus Avoscillospira stercorigallinarum]
MVANGSAWRKNNRREWLRTLGRFFAIVAIVALGVGFFTGLRLARPAMAKTGADYIEETNLYDFQLRSTLGFTEEDAAYFAALDGVETVEPSVSADLLTMFRDREVVFATQELLPTLNQPVLTAGRMPETADECLGDNRYFTEDDLGAVITVQNDPDDEAPFSQEAYTLVGLGSSPQYLSSQRGTSALGNGTVAAFLFLTEAGYDADYYTEIYVQVPSEGAAFSDAYADSIKPWEDVLEDAVNARGELRRTTVIADAEEELADGWAEYYDGLQEYEDGKAEADQELADGKQELDDALQELNDGEADYAEGVETLEALRADPLSNDEIRDARAELDDGWQQYYDGKQEYEDGLKEYEDGKQEYEDGLKEYEDAVAENQPKLDDAKKELEQAKQSLDSGEASYEEGVATYNALLQDPSAVPELAEARRQLDAQRADYNEKLAAYEQYAAIIDGYEADVAEAQATLEALQASGTATEEEIIAAQTNLAFAQAVLDGALAQGGDPDEMAAGLNTYKETLDQAEADFQAGYQEAIQQAEAELAAARKQLDDGWDQYYEGLKEYENGVKELEDGKKELEDAKAELEDGKIELDDAKAELDDAYAELVQGEADYKSGYEDALAEGEQELADARQELDDGWAEYYDGVEEYEEGKLEAEQELADARQELDDALEELEDGESDLYDLKTAPLSVFALTRTANTGYASFDNDTAIVEGLAAIFPVFFFLVAALVCSSTMTRMVDEQRTNNGTLKALGYRDGSIMSRFTAYAAWAAVLGTGLGLAVGAWIFPAVIWRAYTMIYRFADLEFVFDPVLALLSLAAALVCSVGAALASAWNEMRKMPASLMRPKAPKAGKRILLEYMTPLWKHMSFLQKVAARNVFRYKKRLIMMLLGTGGCLALLIAGLGLRDSVANVADDQYRYITLYDYTITFAQGQTEDQQQAFRETWAEDLDHLAFAATDTVDVLTQKGVSTASVVASDDPEITALFGLTYGDETVDWPTGDGAVVSEKLLRLSGISVGDSLTVERSDGTVLEIPVVGAFENYVNHYILLTGQGYETWMGEAPEIDTAYASTASEEITALGARLTEGRSVLSVTLAQDFQAMIADTMQSLDAVISLVVGCALALSFVVSYNLVNINITERVREIATIKVLGFYRWETYSYVFREGLILTGLGCVVGVPLGIWLHRFVMERIQVDMVSFRVRIDPWSYVLALALTLVITLVTDALLVRKIDRIHMAESLKSVE